MVAETGDRRPGQRGQAHNPLGRAREAQGLCSHTGCLKRDTFQLRDLGRSYLIPEQNELRGTAASPGGLPQTPSGFPRKAVPENLRNQ